MHAMHFEALLLGAYNNILQGGGTGRGKILEVK